MTEENGTVEPDDSVHPKEPDTAGATGAEPEQPLEEGAGPDSENVDGEAEARNAEETGGYGY
jgi:hypothetical protein